VGEFFQPRHFKDAAIGAILHAAVQTANCALKNRRCQCPRTDLKFWGARRITPPKTPTWNEISRLLNMIYERVLNAAV
jgi:predicted metal-binding protein